MKPESVKEKVATDKVIRVKLACLHQPINWPGSLINSEKTISLKKCPGISLSLIPQGLLMELNGQKCIVPYANVANAVLETEV